MDYKTIFIVDPVKSERIQLAKFIKHDKFTIMGFVNLNNAIRQKSLKNDLIVYTLRKGKTDLKNLFRLSKKDKNTHFIVLLNAENPEVNLNDLSESGFSSIHKASNNEKVREIAYGLLAPEGLVPRKETPHPVPIP